ncbi:MAG: hypothetical protein A2096_12225 [Spirochaetes bacterium GWF1_41_5]|nr:MAG: hypothetical protein A2096_12225 [Spirochaetes bacterium GWF1_41_5]HBE04075.1 hypothetical protein [Spirochaetia bacterium]
MNNFKTPLTMKTRISAERADISFQNLRQFFISRFQLSFFILLLGTYGILCAKEKDKVLLLDFDFSKDSGSALRDKAGKSDGIIHGAKWIKTNDRYLLSFNGKSDYVEIPLSEKSAVNEQISVEIQATSGSWIPFIYADNAFAIRFKIKPKTFEVQIKTDKQYNMENPQKNYADNTLYYIVFTFDGQKAALYINGEENKVITAAGKMALAGKKILLGASNKNSGDDKPAYFFSGQIGLVKIHNKILTVEEIQKNFNSLGIK